MSDAEFKEVLARETEKLQIIHEVMNHMDWPKEKAELWYKTDNGNFGGVSPELLVNRGRAHKVLKFIEAAKEGY